MSNANYNVYSGNQIGNNSGKVYDTSYSSNSKVIYEESEAARNARKRLYGRRQVEERPQIISPAQKKKLAKEQVLNALTDSTIIDPIKVTDVMADWATNDLGVDDQVSQRIFSQSLLTTQSVPNKNVFRIRIKL